MSEAQVLEIASKLAMIPELAGGSMLVTLAPECVPAGFIAELVRLATLALALGTYRFGRYRKND